MFAYVVHNRFFHGEAKYVKKYDFDIIFSYSPNNHTRSDDIIESRHEKTVFAYAKTKTQISFAVTAKLISAFVLATYLV